MSFVQHCDPEEEELLREQLEIVHLQNGDALFFQPGSPSLV